MDSKPDAVVVGAGPNGLTAAVVLARAGLAVEVFEAGEEIGGGTRTAELTLTGFRHDVCSAIHPFSTSAAFADMPLDRFGLEWVGVPIELAHPLDGGDAVFLRSSVEDTIAQFPDDASVYRRGIGRYAAHADELFADLFGPLLKVPRHPLRLSRFGLPALLSGARYSSRLQSPRAKALFLGASAHNLTSLREPGSAGVALALLAAGHAYGWVIAKGGSHAITRALAGYLGELGGVIHTGAPIADLGQLPPARLTLLSVPPPAFAQMAGDRLALSDRARLESWVFGPGVFKVDWALDGPVPWDHADVGKAGTVHVIGTGDEVIRSEEQMWRGEHADRPFVLFAQQSLFDHTRAPEGKHTGWGYCHVPSGSTIDMTNAIEAQIERFAPGFRDRILDRHTMSSEDFERYNANYVGGDIGSGVFTLKQILARPRFGTNPYRTALAGVYLCGSSTAPGAGAHGMPGWNAANAALSSLGHGSRP